MYWPVLTPCDFLLGLKIKSKVYGTCPKNITNMKERIIAAFNKVTVDMRHRIKVKNKYVVRYIKENNKFKDYLNE